jgi:hypothetical protein
MIRALRNFLEPKDSLTESQPQKPQFIIERMVIEDALAGLKVLKRELGFPDWEKK